MISSENSYDNDNKNTTLTSLTTVQQHRNLILSNPSIAAMVVFLSSSLYRYTSQKCMIIQD